MTALISVWANVFTNVLNSLGSLITFIMDEDNILLLVPIGFVFVYAVIKVFKSLI